MGRKRSSGMASLLDARAGCARHNVALMSHGGTIVMFMCNSVPRLMSDLWHAREFIPAQNFTITNYKCTNWNGFMFNECTATFVSQKSRESRQITDWRFGRAPRDPVQLLQRPDDASSVTTDVSLRT